MIPDLAERAAETVRAPRNKAARIFRSLAFADFIGGAAAVLLAYFSALLYVYHTQAGNNVSFFVFFKTSPNVHMRNYIENFPRYAFAFFAVHTVVNWLFGQFEQRKKFDRYRYFYPSMISGLVAVGGVVLLSWMMKSTWHMRGFFTMLAFSQILFSILVGYLTREIVGFLFAKKLCERAGALLVGDDKTSKTAQILSQQGKLGAYEIVRQVPAPPQGADVREFLGKIFAETPGIDAVFVFGANIGRDAKMELVVESALAGKYAKATLRLHENSLLSSPDFIADERITHFDCPRSAREGEQVRMIGATLLAALALLPLMILHPIIALLIRADSNGATVFKQKRYGLFGEKFTMAKYRTMLANAEDARRKLGHLNENDGGLFKIKTDPRITKTGSWLRKSSLDELPQFLNILRGEMLFVGPRPLPCDDLTSYKNRWQSARFFCKPGITGVWQVAGRAHVKFDEMCEMDIWYALNRSLRFDLMIIWRTVKSVVFGVGAY